MVEAEVKEIVDALSEISEDNTVPKNVKAKIDAVVKILNDDSIELSVRVNKALNEFEEIADDSNTQAYTRTQIWNIVSLLEKLNTQ